METWYGPCPVYREPPAYEPEAKPELTTAESTPSDCPSAKEFFDRFVRRTPEQCFVERTLPQRSAEWIRARRWTLTASRFADAAGWMGESSQRRLAMDMAGLLPREPACAAMRYGTSHEPLAREAYLRWLRQRGEAFVELREEGLVRLPDDQSWIAASPDGILERPKPLAPRLVEFKCPYYRRHHSGYPYKDFIPRHYQAQIQGVMAILGLSECDFVVYQPHRIWVTRVAFDRTQWESELFPALREFYFGKFLPLVRAGRSAIKRPLELAEPAQAAEPAEAAEPAKAAKAAEPAKAAQAAKAAEPKTE